MAKKPPSQFPTGDPGINYSAMMQPGGGGIAAQGNGSGGLMHPEMKDNPAAAQGFRKKPRARGGRAAAQGGGRAESRGGATKKKFKPRGGWGAYHAAKKRR